MFTTSAPSNIGMLRPMNNLRSAELRRWGSFASPLNRTHSTAIHCHLVKLGKIISGGGHGPKFAFQKNRKESIA